MENTRDTATARPRVTIRRCLSDFGPSGGLFLQPGCTTCCCCCLHWIGAAIGGSAGLVAAWRSTKRGDLAVHAKARRHVFWWMWLGFVPTSLGILGLTWLAMFSSDFAAIPLGALVFVPSLAFLPVGLCAFVGAWIADRKINARHQGEPPSQTGAFRLAWRIAWMSFLFSTLLSGVGYLVMLLIYIVF